MHTLQKEKTVQDRLQQTMDAAMTERDKYLNRGVLSVDLYSHSSRVLMTMLFQPKSKGYSSTER